MSEINEKDFSFYPFNRKHVRLKYRIGFFLYALLCAWYIYVRFVDESNISNGVNVFFVALIAFPFVYAYAFYQLSLRENDYVKVDKENVILKICGDIVLIDIRQIQSIAYFKRGSYVLIETKNMDRYKIRTVDFKNLNYVELVRRIQYFSGIIL